MTAFAYEGYLVFVSFIIHSGMTVREPARSPRLVIRIRWPRRGSSSWTTSRHRAASSASAEGLVKQAPTRGAQSNFSRARWPRDAVRCERSLDPAGPKISIEGYVCDWIFHQCHCGFCGFCFCLVDALFRILTSGACGHIWGSNVHLQAYDTSIINGKFIVPD